MTNVVLFIPTNTVIPYRLYDSPAPILNLILILCGLLLFLFAWFRKSSRPS